MTNTLISLLATALVLFSFHSAQADEYTDTKQVFMNAGESAAYFENAYGYALFPTIGKGGMGIGGAHGSGRVFAGGAHVGNTKMTQLSIGWQLGGQAYSQVIFFEDKRAFEDFTSGNFEFGAQATAVAITASAGAQATTGGGAQAGAAGGKNDASTVSGGYRKGMAVFTVAKGGLMYEATVAGQKYSFTPL
ncbi:YSC84-related protein [Pseudohalioglobus lutimaris]|uniref:Ysc84 actin-binding domain-containing protein n=1 Tax=Pseudohalioglobus lutimaris TaxID=1737061 RepID=A0A2N5X060_9GAMM|nr:YSC84-related protein [Pseudohalioglobus lutimaris]PLW67895.1 hypothetical protein C0039_14735 [Pseudohalioglobus lutimaris]